jgi:hypothetical protein
MREISNGSPGWMRTVQAALHAVRTIQPALLAKVLIVSVRRALKITVMLQRTDFPALST